MNRQRSYHTALALMALVATVVLVAAQQWFTYQQLQGERQNVERMHALTVRLAGAVQQSQQGAAQTGAEQWRRSFAELEGLVDLTFSSDNVDISPDELKQSLAGIAALHEALMNHPAREVSDALRERREALLIERLLVQTQYLSE